MARDTHCRSEWWKSLYASLAFCGSHSSSVCRTVGSTNEIREGLRGLRVDAESAVASTLAMGTSLANMCAKDQCRQPPLHRLSMWPGRDFSLLLGFWMDCRRWCWVLPLCTLFYTWGSRTGGETLQSKDVGVSLANFTVSISLLCVLHVV